MLDTNMCMLVSVCLSVCVYVQWLLINSYSFPAMQSSIWKSGLFSCFGVKMCFSLLLKDYISGCQMYNAMRLSHFLNMVNNDDMTVRELN